MGRNARARAVRDTGSTTGVATAILALLSAGTVASISLVGAHQLAPAISERLRAGEPGAVHAPATVVVTPRAPATAPTNQVVSHRHTTKAHAPARVTVLAALLTPPSSQVHSPVTLPAIPVAHPALTPPAVPIPPLPAPPVPNVSPLPVAAPVPGYPPEPAKPRRHRHGDAVAYTPSPQVPVAVLGEKHGKPRGDKSGCRQHANGDQRDRHGAGCAQGQHDGSGDQYGCGQGQHDGSGDQHGCGQGQHDGSGGGRGRDDGRNNSDNGHHGH